MKAIKFLFILLPFSVYSQIDTIEINNDTISYGEIFKAKIYINHFDSVLPTIYVIQNSDTFLIPFFETEKYAMIQAIGRLSGFKTFNGFVEYLNNNREKRKESFSISYYCKD